LRDTGARCSLSPVATPTGPRPHPLLLSARKLTITGLFALAIVAGALVGVFLAYENDLPQVSTLEDFRPNIITQVFAADGSLVGQFAIENRVPIGFSDIPPVFRNAVVAVEDADFWKHIGVNPWRIPGAAIANLRSGRRGQGFSTLTMQLSRLLFLTPEKTYERKIKEIILAFQIEKNFTKEEILTLYCNQVYFGHGNYGVEAASRFFFGKRTRDLTLAEAALLAGLPQSPGRLSPIDSPEHALQRRNHVLVRMREEKYITPDEERRAASEPLRLHLRRPPPSIAPYFLEEVRKYLEREYGSQRIYQGGLRVYTTLDPRLQHAANRAVEDGLRRLDRSIRGYVPLAPPQGEVAPPDENEELPPLVEGTVVRGRVIQSDRFSALVRVNGIETRVSPADIAWTGRRHVDEVLPTGVEAPFRVVSVPEPGQPGAPRLSLEQDPELQGALVALDPKTGAVRAMVGGYDFEKSKFNRATQALRQVGSAFKPIVYTAAIEAGGWTPATTIIDSPISFPDGTGKGLWTPNNYDGTFLGPITLRQALEKSRNIPAIKTLQHVGVKTGIEYAHRLGITNDLPPYLPIAIGAGQATVLDMATVFGTFANQGLRMRPFLIQRITDRDGNTVEETRPFATDAIRADTAYIMTSLLRGVVERGTAVRARVLKRPVAGKTGTTNDWTDGWFVGFEPSLTAAVWVGFDDNRKSLGRGRDGARTALPIWIDFWREAMEGQPMEDYPVPANIVFMPVDGTGHPASPGTPGAHMEVFFAGDHGRAQRAPNPLHLPPPPDSDSAP
jgi:penicillin-binding protein 1A